MTSNVNEIPQTILHSMTSGLILLSLHSPHTIEPTDGTGNASQAQARARSLLVHIHQRHPTTLQRAFQEALSTSNGEDQEAFEADTDKNHVEQLLLSLSVQLPQAGAATGEVRQEEDLVVATVNADATVRARAVRGLYDSLTAGDLTGLDIVSAKFPNFFSMLFYRVLTADWTMSLPRRLFTQRSSLAFKTPMLL